MSNGTQTTPQPKPRRRAPTNDARGPLGHLFTNLIPHFTFEWPAAIACAMFLGLFLGVTSQNGFWDGTGTAFARLLTRTPPPPPVCYGSVLVVAANPQDRLTAALTVQPRGYNAVIAETSKDGLARFHQHEGDIKIAVIEGGLPGGERLAALLGRSLPKGHVIVLRNPRSPEVLPTLLLNLL